LTEDQVYLIQGPLEASGMQVVARWASVRSFFFFFLSFFLFFSLVSPPSPPRNATNAIDKNSLCLE
jgi:hypothetical protein